MTALRSVWVSLIWLFVILIPVQFYLAGHGAMEGGHSADKASGKPPVLTVMSNAWDPHIAVGTIMALLAILIVLVALTSRLPGDSLLLSVGLFVLMLAQYILPFFNDSASTRGIAALHAVNALLVTGLAVMLALRSRPYLPIGRSSSPAHTEASAP